MPLCLHTTFPILEPKSHSTRAGITLRLTDDGVNSLILIPPSARYNLSVVQVETEES